MQRSFITGFSAINAIGNNCEEIWQNWQIGKAPGMRLDGSFGTDEPCYLGHVDMELPELAAEYQDYDCRNNRLLLVAIEQLAKQLADLFSRVNKKRIGVVLGSSTSGIENSEIAMKQLLEKGERPSWYHTNQQDVSAPAEFFRRVTGIEGPSFVVSTACTSSANAFVSAQRLMALDLCDAVIVGGVDTLCQMTVKGFSALASVSQARCQPFSQNRKGINIGEAAALLILERRPLDSNSIELYGAGCSSDAHHMSAPDPTGHGAVVAMKAAFAGVPWQLSDVDYINLHGTATPLNDAMESKAVFELFADKAVCSSTKSLTGHCLGAAAATEAVLCCLLLQHSEAAIPAQVWDGERDVSLPNITIASAGQTSKKVKLCLSNSFAFGGSNVSVLLGLPKNATYE